MRVRAPRALCRRYRRRRRQRVESLPNCIGAPFIGLCLRASSRVIRWKTRRWEEKAALDETEKDTRRLLPAAAAVVRRWNSTVSWLMQTAFDYCVRRWVRRNADNFGTDRSATASRRTAIAISCAAARAFDATAATAVAAVGAAGIAYGQPYANERVCYLDDGVRRYRRYLEEEE